MSDKLNQFDDEVAVNEDVNDTQDLSNRSNNRVLEGIYSYTIGYDHGASSYFVPLCILGGFEIEFAADSTLDYSISNGEALIVHDESTESDGNVWTTGHFVDQYKRNNVQQARHTTAETSVYPYSMIENLDSTKDRIDIIEIRFDRVETAENRYKLVTIGNRRVQQETSVDKYVEYVMSDVRVRLGDPVEPPDSPDYDYGPRMAALDPDVSVPEQTQWLPIAAVYIPANTTGFSSQPTIYDLRKFFQSKNGAGILNGPIQSVNASTKGEGPSGGPWEQTLIINKNAVADDGFIFPISGPSKDGEDENLTTRWIPLSVSTENHASTVCSNIWPLVDDTFYYVYSFRASPRIGYTGLCVSGEEPQYSSVTYGKAGNPDSAFTPPPPWPNRYNYINPNSPMSGTLGAYIKEHAFYITAFTCYDDSGDVQPRPFKRFGNYVHLSQERFKDYSEDASTDTVIYDAILGTGNDINPVQALNDPAAYPGSPPGTRKVIPTHAAGVRIFITHAWDSSSQASDVYILSEEGENYPAGDGYVFACAGPITINTSEVAPVPTIVDVPLQPGYETKFWVQTIGTAGGSFYFTIRVLGYYEPF